MAHKTIEDVRFRAGEKLLRMCDSGDVHESALQEVLESAPLLQTREHQPVLRNKEGLGPVHLLCRNPCVEVDTLVLLLNSFGHEASIKLGFQERNALHYLCDNAKVSVEILALLVECCFDAAKAASAKDGYGFTALDILRRRYDPEGLDHQDPNDTVSSSEIVSSFALMIDLQLSKDQLFSLCEDSSIDKHSHNMESILSRCPEAAKERDENLNYPLHILCKSRHITVRSLELLIDAFPAATREQNAEGRCPLNLLCENDAAVSNDLIACMIELAPEDEHVRNATSPTKGMRILFEYMDNQTRDLSPKSSSTSTIEASTMLDSPKHAQRYTVIFEEQVLGINLIHDGVLPSVEENLTGKPLPNVGDILEFVNNTRLDPAAMEDTWAVAVDMIQSSGRPLMLGFLSYSKISPTKRKKNRKKKKDRDIESKMIETISARSISMSSPVGDKNLRASRGRVKEPETQLKHYRVTEILLNLNVLASLKTGDKLRSSIRGEHGDHRFGVDRRGMWQGVARALRTEMTGVHERRHENIDAIEKLLHQATDTFAGIESSLRGKTFATTSFFDTSSNSLDGNEVIVAQLDDGMRRACVGLKHLSLTYGADVHTKMRLEGLIFHLKASLSAASSSTPPLPSPTSASP